MWFKERFVSLCGGPSEHYEGVDIRMIVEEIKNLCGEKGIKVEIDERYGVPAIVRKESTQQKVMTFEERSVMLEEYVVAICEAF